MAGIPGGGDTALHWHRPAASAEEYRPPLARWSPAFLTLGGSLEVDENLQSIARVTREALGAQLCLVLSFQEESPMLRVRAAGAAALDPVDASVRLDAGSLALRVLESGLPVWVEDGAEPPRLNPRDQGLHLRVRAAVGVPIHDGPQVSGAILVYYDQPRRSSPDETELLMGLAGQAGMALRNAALYEHQRAIAETVQRSLLPRLPASVAGLDVGYAYLPRKGQVGGDYYDLIPFADGRIGMVVGDVCGSGLKAAIHTAMGKYTLRAFAFEHVAPSVVMRQVNEAICAQSHSEVFLTLCYAVLEPDGRLVYTNAAHPYPLLRRADGTLARLETTGTVVGILPGESYHQRELRAGPGDTLFFYTDGAIEAGRPDEMFGLERLEAIVGEWPGGHPQELVDLLVDRVTHFSAGRRQDDLAVLAVRLR